MWPSVLSQGRSVPLPAPSISRMQRSPQARNRLRPLARLIPPGSPHRSMSASTTRPVRHNVPSQLSIVARPHEDGLMCSWRADSLCLRVARSRNYPCCKSRRFQLQVGWLDLLERPSSCALRGRWHYRLVLTPALVRQDMHPLLAVVERSASRACEDSARSLPV